MSFHFSCIHFSFYFFFNAFPLKITLGPWHGVGVGVFICGHGHRAKKWRTVGQKVTYSGPKCDVRGAEKWRTGQNATLECYNSALRLLIYGAKAMSICEEYHGSSHVGTEYVLSLIRNKFWVFNARPMLKSMRRNCVVCKRMCSQTCSQKMADLPPQRCQPYHPPFSNFDVDIFGLFNVTQKRSHVKRYGCVFSCFVTRAIHLEVLSSMETDSFINAFIRFVVRPGAPLKVRSDNGTNLAPS